MKDTNAILSIAYKECEDKIKKNLNNYKKYVSAFMNARSQQLYSNMPSQMIYFTVADADEFFLKTNIDRKAVQLAISKTYYAEIANFNPRYAKDDTTIAMLCLVRYFLLHKMEKELELSLILMSFSGKFYPSIWYGSYPVAAPQEHVMDYVINYMCNNKFDIVREGNVIGAIRSVSRTWVDSYTSRFKEFSDDDCQYLVQQLHNRIRSFMNNIAELYYQAYENKEYLTYDSDDISEDNYRLADSDSLKMERVVSNTMNRLSSKGVDYRICKMASNSDVKMNELKSIIENLLANNNNNKLLREYITLTVAIYFQQPGNNKDVRDLDFISYSIKAKPNSKDKYLVRHKELITIMLVNNSEHFMRRKSRKATEAAYYKAINAYFAISIQEANK